MGSLNAVTLDFIRVYLDQVITSIYHSSHCFMHKGIICTIWLFRAYLSSLISYLDELTCFSRLTEKITRQQGELITRIDHWDEFIKKYYEFIKQDWIIRIFESVNIISASMYSSKEYFIEDKKSFQNYRMGFNHFSTIIIL